MNVYGLVVVAQFTVSLPTLVGLGSNVNLNNKKIRYENNVRNTVNDRFLKKVKRLNESLHLVMPNGKFIKPTHGRNV